MSFNTVLVDGDEGPAVFGSLCQDLPDLRLALADGAGDESLLALPVEDHHVIGGIPDVDPDEHVVG